MLCRIAILIVSAEAVLVGGTLLWASVYWAVVKRTGWEE